MQRSQAARVAALTLLCCCAPFAASALPFPVYEPCSRLPGSGTKLGMCRRTARPADRTQQQVKIAAARVLPVDMRFPCADPSAACDANIDVVRPTPAPDAHGIGACNVTLMPWSPFPCSYNADAYTGVAGQRSNHCYGGGEGGALTANLSTNGYTNLFYGVLPARTDRLCGEGWTDKTRLVRMLLTIDFRLAAGRQFDRTYSFQIGNAVVGGDGWRVGLVSGRGGVMKAVDRVAPAAR